MGRRILLSLLVSAPLIQSDPSALTICPNQASLGEKQRSWSQAEMVMEYLAVHSFGSLQAVNTGRSWAQDDRTCCSVEAKWCSASAEAKYHFHPLLLVIVAMSDRSLH